MGTSNKAIDRFIETVERAHQLVRLYIDLVSSAPEAPPAAASDVVRGAIVLAVAGMDAYFTRRFVEILVPYIKKHGATKGLIDLLARAGLNTEQGVLMAGMDRPFRRIRTLVDGYLAGYTTQRFYVIDELFLCFGVKDLSKNAQAKTRKKTVLSRVEKLVLRRHDIVHDGDHNKHGRVQPIDPNRTLVQMRSLIAFVRAADEIITRAAKV